MARIWLRFFRFFRMGVRLMGGMVVSKERGSKGARSAGRSDLVFDGFDAEGGEQEVEDNAAFFEVLVLGGEDEFDQAIGAGDKGVAGADVADGVEADGGVNKTGGPVAGGAGG